LKVVGCNVLLPIQEEAIQNWGLKKWVLYEATKWIGWRIV